MFREKDTYSSLPSISSKLMYILERGNSLELDDRSPSHLRSSPPAIHLSPSRQSSSSTDGGGGIGGGTGSGAASATGSTGATTGTIVAKKKRELFSSARSSRSGGSNKSSDFDSSSSKVSKLRILSWIPKNYAPL